MIQSKITGKAQATVPRAVRSELQLGAGDSLRWEIEGDRVIVSASRAETADFAAFGEWADKLDSVYDDL